jgi:Phytase/Bacterial type II and III secretion system protein
MGSCPETGLSKIPGLGALFRSSNKLKSRKEVIVVITPHVIPVDDRSYAKSVAKDSDLLDNFDLKLYRDSYRIRREDVFDLDFIRDNELYKDAVQTAEKKVDELLGELGVRIREAGKEETRERRAVRKSRGESSRGKRDMQSLDVPPPLTPEEFPPLAPGDARGKAAQIRKARTRLSEVVEESRRADPESDSARFLSHLGNSFPKDLKVDEAVLQLLEDRIPGEEYLVTRMLEGLLKDRAVVFPDTEDRRSLWSKLKAYFGPEWKKVKSRLYDLGYTELIRDNVIYYDAAMENGAVLEPRFGLPDDWEDWGNGKCSTYKEAHTEEFERLLVKLKEQGLVVENGSPVLTLWFRGKGLSGDSNAGSFYPPSAELGCIRIANNHQAYLKVLRYLNCRSDGGDWESLAILLTKPFGQSEQERRKEVDASFERLKRALIIKRIKDVNTPQLMTLDGFHVGREVVFPPVSDLMERKHLVDRETAEIFLGMTDYYKTFEDSFAVALRDLGNGIAPEPSYCSELQGEAGGQGAAAVESPAADGEPDKVEEKLHAGPVSGDPDDVAIWINRDAPSKSLVLGTDKGRMRYDGGQEIPGGLYAFDLEGGLYNSLTSRGYNSVDVEYGLEVAGKKVDIAVATTTEKQRIQIFRLPDMEAIDGGGIDVSESSPPMGVALYKRPSDGQPKSCWEPEPVDSSSPCRTTGPSTTTPGPR